MDEIKGVSDIGTTMLSMEKNVCQICGKDATCFAFDVTAIAEDGYIIYRVRGKPKYGCNEHIPETNKYSVDGFLIGKG